ncbi:MAG: A/G-specific adenine glycosylase [Novosphingobium sp.]|uniref:A/G-specific adenine glycosylase n=1 Tax=Novosphingobium sp. TaxID=1874826 RepID=UPI0032BE0020
MDASAKTVSAALLAWYDTSHRSLPWRSPPGQPPPANDDNWPYRVWLSEVMLQQTTVAAVIPYFERFTQRWPTVLALAGAEDADVMAAWAGLGYYARARNLIACARAVAARGGQFPQTETDLRLLPGLGAYTAAAVAAIAFGERAAVVDANVERVVARLRAIDTPLPASRAAIWAAVDQLTPADRPGDFAQAMMDLGAGICSVRQPRCALCPLQTHCHGRAAGPERFPVKPPKATKPVRRGQTFWIVRDGAVWLVRREAKGMLGGMRALPSDSWSARGDGQGDPPLAGNWQSGGVVRHSFTHFDLELQLMLYSGGDWARLEPHQGEWWPMDRIEEAGLPTLFAKAARLAVVTEIQGETG